MKFTLSLLLVAFTLCSFIHAEDVPEDGIFVLNDKNFKRILLKRQFVLMLFENSTTNETNPIVKEYSKAALKLQTICPQLKLWKFNGTLTPAQQNKYNITSFPAIRLLRENGNTIKTFNEEVTSQKIIDWFVDEMEDSSTNLHIQTIEQAQELIKNKTHVAFYFGAHNSSGFLNFLSGLIALNDPTVTMASSKIPEVAQHFNVSNDTYVFFRQSDAERSFLKFPFNHQSVKEFTKKRMHPAVVPWDKKAVERFSNEEMDGLFLFRSNSSTEELKLEKMIRTLAPEYRDNFTFVVAGEEDLEHGPMIKRFYLSEDDFPKIGILQARQNGKIFMLDRNISSENNVRIFLENFLQDNLHPTKIEEKTPLKLEWHDDAAVVTKETYQQAVLDSKKSVLVEAYNPHCGACVRFAPTYAALAKKVRDVKGLMVAKVDLTKGSINEFYRVYGTPTVLLYVKGKKDQPIKYDGPRTEEEMMKFLTEHLGPLMA